MSCVYTQNLRSSHRERNTHRGVSAGTLPAGPPALSHPARRERCGHSSVHAGQATQPVWAWQLGRGWKQRRAGNEKGESTDNPAAARPRGLGVQQGGGQEDVPRQHGLQSTAMAGQEGGSGDRAAGELRGQAAAGGARWRGRRGTAVRGRRRLPCTPALGCGSSARGSSPRPLPSFIVPRPPRAMAAAAAAPAPALLAAGGPPWPAAAPAAPPGPGGGGRTPAAALAAASAALSPSGRARRRRRKGGQHRLRPAAASPRSAPAHNTSPPPAARERRG